MYTYTKATNTSPLLSNTQLHTQLHTWKATSSTLNSCVPELLGGSQAGRLVAAPTCMLSAAAVQAYLSLQDSTRNVR
jgi:hypothetical protein